VLNEVVTKLSGMLIQAAIAHTPQSIAQVVKPVAQSDSQQDLAPISGVSAIGR
jgi:hypothetical protein